MRFNLARLRPRTTAFEIKPSLQIGLQYMMVTQEPLNKFWSKELGHVKVDQD